MTEDELRRIENYAISQPLSGMEDPDMIAFVGTLIQDHDHLREKLLTEPDRAKRRMKFEHVRAHLKFKAFSVDDYELAEEARRCGVQPIYREAEQLEQSRIWMPPSFIHEVRG